MADSATTRFGQGGGERRPSLLFRLIREPLLHFLLLGGLLFFLYTAVNRDDAPAYDEIVIDEDRVAMLVSRYERTWQRRPTEAELLAVIDAWVRDEVLYREGLALGLDRDDPVVRQRIAQKMDFISEGIVPAPGDDDLAAWLEEKADSYRRPARYAFEQRFVDPGRHGQDLAGYARDALAALRAGSTAAADTVGDPTMLPPTMGPTGEDQVMRTFGAEFSAQLADLPVGEWGGPVRSAFGLHLVRIVDSEPARVPPLSEIRDEVERDWLSAESEAVQEALYRAMRDRYTVRLDFDPTGRAGNPEP